MLTKQIIRVEHSDGFGMFMGALYDNNGIYISDRDHKVSIICPSISNKHQLFNSPFEDGLDINNDDFCAYKDTIELRRWIRQQEFSILFDNDYKVYQIEVSHWQEGRDNVLFKKEHIISKIDISNQFK